MSRHKHQHDELAAADDPARIRNVVVVGHSGSGKTTLVEAALFTAGAISRAGSVGEGTTVTDADPSAIKQGRSVEVSVASSRWRDHTINFIDTPGYGDFVAELRAGLRAADAALFVVSAAHGVDPATIELWHECAEVDLPRAIVVTHLDHQRADYDAIVAIGRRVFGDGVAALAEPVHDDENPEYPVIGSLDLLRATIVDYRDGSPTAQPAESGHLEATADGRQLLLEAVIAESEDEQLLGRYVGGDLGTTPEDVELLAADLRTAIARATFFPVLPVDAVHNVGLVEVLNVVVDGFGPPNARPAPVVTTLSGEPVTPPDVSPGGPLLAEVIKTITDPYVGRLSVIRVFSGTVSPDAPVHIAGHGYRVGLADHDEDVRVGKVFSVLGAALREVSHAIAGDVCAVSKLSTAVAGDTVSMPADPRLIAAWSLPEPLFPTALTGGEHSDADDVASALSKLAAADPTIRYEHSETGQLLLWTAGQAHTDVVADRLRAAGVDIATEPVRVGLRETFAKPVQVTGRHVKQSGGHGQFAVVTVAVEPLARGAGVEFVSEVVGGAVSARYVTAVEKAVHSEVIGPQGHLLVDFRVRLLDGKMHNVDSSEAAFQAAAGGALRSAAADAGTVVLEPVDTVEVRAPQGFVGPLLSEVAARHGRVLATGAADDSALITAELPARQLIDFAPRIRALSQGTASLSRRFARFDPVNA